ncbi:MAG: replication endonuclease [Sodalis sp. (in: enterobacteria)]|uniref:replication endonuclease n=1 Tax=Sodalis sp. (in: enterobacteria) TaxID=1898979 RepID=UPI0039E6433A
MGASSFSRQADRNSCLVSYPNGVWACARDKCHRQGLRFFGMRVAEPHHDGTTHAHLLIFARPEDMARI